ncbi:MAG: hypothetical protein AUH20_03780 [Candidatus Rokubacteria bacterium 13_2_20CM_69_15_2]|nr:MAG: hypothetical protein AUH20_03780 [Candidatus Rokubacteria bacterium 13_2_20CM_69_15_2]
MATQTDATTIPESRTTALYQEGLVAGLVGAATIALWFLILDSLSGRPLYTPTVLGTALFRRGGTTPLSEILPNLEMVLMFTWVHGLVFVAIGGIVARLLALAERQPSVGFGILMLFVFFEFGFIVAAMFFAEPILHALAWPAVLVANILAAAAMGGYFWLRHPNLRVQP